MLLDQNEIEQIIVLINGRFNQVLAEYDYGKYPAADYQDFKRGFSEFTADDKLIRNALRWKWGHWAKTNYPETHKELIAEVSKNWKKFVTLPDIYSSAQNTFDWWREALRRDTRYITVAYITHLVHHRKLLPIIDQHNFRAMNSLVSEVRPTHRSKKKPSNWNDIQDLKQFMDVLLPELRGGPSFGDLDRFLMMYGRNHAPRSSVVDLSRRS